MVKDEVCMENKQWLQRSLVGGIVHLIEVEVLFANLAKEWISIHKV